MMRLGLGPLELLFVIAFWAFLILLAVLLVRAIFGRGGQRPPPDQGRSLTAREILDERYARGEITREQYELMKRDIS